MEKLLIQMWILMHQVLLGGPQQHQQKQQLNIHQFVQKAIELNTAPHDGENTVSDAEFEVYPVKSEIR